jgi:hypothetical protein
VSASSISTNFGAAARVVAVELRRDAQEGPRREQQRRELRGRVHEDRAEVLRERAQRQPPELLHAGLAAQPTASKKTLPEL